LDHAISYIESPQIVYIGRSIENSMAFFQIIEKVHDCIELDPATSTTLPD